MTGLKPLGRKHKDGPKSGHTFAKTSLLSRIPGKIVPRLPRYPLYLFPNYIKICFGGDATVERAASLVLGTRESTFSLALVKLFCCSLMSTRQQKKCLRPNLLCTWRVNLSGRPRVYSMCHRVAHTLLMQIFGWGKCAEALSTEYPQPKR